MHDVRCTLPVLASFLLLFGCKKEALTATGCELFLRGLASNNANVVRIALKPSMTAYSQENLNKLIAEIAKGCTITAASLCFDCVYTNPAQSEITFTFTYAGVSMQKIVDISRTLENKMKIVGVHD